MFFKMTQNQLERKLKILRAAAMSFATFGFHVSDINEIAKNAGVGKGTLYRYFQNKEDLFFESVKFCADEMYDYIAERLENADYDKFAETLFDAHQDYYHDHKDAYIFVSKALSQMPKTIVHLFHEVHKEKMELLKQKLQKGVEAGKIKNVDLDVLIKMLDVISQLFFLTKDISPDTEDYQCVKETFVNVFNYGILK